MKTPYLGKPAKNPKPERRRGKNPLDLVGRPTEPQTQPEPQSQPQPEPELEPRPATDERRRIFRLGPNPMLVLAAVAAIWAGLQAYGAHPPRGVPLEAPALKQLIKLRVNTSSVARVVGADPTWRQLFDLYGVEPAVRARTLNDAENRVGGGVPAPDVPIRVPVVTIVLSG